MSTTTPAPPIPDMIVIFRGPSPRDIVAATERLINVGYRAFEVSLTTPDAIEAIQLLSKAVGDSALVGAGTVRTVDEALRVHEAGARIVLSPVTSGAVIEAATQTGMVAIPGAYTATEATTALELGADVVKLFPAASAGLDYFRMLREPLPDIPFLVTGGVDAPMARQFLDLGAVSVGVGHRLIGGAHLEEHDWARFEQQAAHYLAVAHGETSGF